MPGTVLIDDQFTGLTSGALIAGRVPPTSDSGEAFVVDPANKTSPVTADGSGNVKFNYSGCAVKTGTLATNYAPSIIFNDGGVSQAYILFVRDSANTPYPRYGFQMNIVTRFSGDRGMFNCARIDNFTGTKTIQDTLFDFSLSQDNTAAFEVSGSNFRAILNNSVVGTFTDTAYPTNKKVGFGGNGDTSHAGRVRGFTVYDSIVVTATQQYTVVRFS
jgi:hypothetical protein